MGVKVQWQVIIFGWVLLAIEVLAMGVLYLDGGGRIAALEAEDSIDSSVVVDSSNLEFDGEYECVVSGGPPFLAFAVGIRAVVAVCTQLLMFCISDRGLLKPYEAMWFTFAYVIRRWLTCTACFLGALEYESTTRVETERDSNGNYVRHRTVRDDNPCCLCSFGILWGLIPLWFFWLFTGRIAGINLSAVCELLLNEERVLYWFSIGSLAVIIVVGLMLLHYLLDSQFARALVVMDSVAIGITSVWGNYVQSGLVAGVFCLLPVFNLIVQCIEWLRSDSTVDAPGPDSSEA